MNMPAPPRRVLMTADTVGGVWTYALELCRGLAAQDCRVTLATMGRKLSRQQAWEANGVPHLQVRESEFKLEWMAQPWADVDAAGDWLLEIERAESPDIVHLNGYTHGSLPWHAPVLMVGHSCVSSWWRAVNDKDPPEEWAEYKRRVTEGLRAADVVVAPTRAMLECLEQHYGLLSSRFVIANGRTYPSRKRRAKEPIIFSAGRLWDAAKNIAALEAVAAELPWRVVVAGEEHQQGAPSAVTRLGQLDSADVWDWLERSTIYALPARYEPFGLSILEAALSGCALVLGDIRSLREVWSDAALYVPPSNQEALRDTLARLISDPALAREMGRKAHVRAQMYSPRAMTQGYIAAYRWLMCNESQPREALAV